jgi:hypothetical protein
MTTENSKIEICEIINDVPVRFTVYHRNASMSGNFVHSFMSPGREYTWFIIGEVNDDNMTTEEFFASPLAQYEGVFWCGNTEDADYQDTLAKVRAVAAEDIESRNPPVPEQPEPEWIEPGYIGDGFTNEYDYDHPVHGNAFDNAVLSGAIELPEADTDDEYQAQHEALENEIAATVRDIRQQQEAAERAAIAIYELKNRLEALLKERGSNWQDEDGYARLAAPGVRVNYSREALDSLILNDPLQYGWLKQYRKESELAARVVVK